MIVVAIALANIIFLIYVDVTSAENPYLGIMAYIKMVDDPLVVHEHLSQRDEELMHFMEGKYQLDFCCTTPEAQHHVEDALGYLLHQIGGFGRSPQPVAAK